MELKEIEILLRIDHVRYDPFLVYPLYQSNPYPRGHCWFLSFMGPNTETLFKGISDPFKGSPEEVEERDILFQLQFILPGRDKETTYKYFLNSIYFLEIEKGNIRRAGICSPVLKTKKKV